MSAIPTPEPREIPVGKVLLSENPDPSERARFEILDRATNNGTEYQLVSVSAGFEPAGSCSRWTNGYYAVRFHSRDAINGRRFKSRDDAIALFTTWARGC